MVWYIWLFDPVGRYLAADQRGDTYDGVFFLPDQMLNASNGVDELMSATPMWIDLLVVAVTPAICEEIAFRGALLTCFAWDAEQMDWDYYRRIILWCVPWQRVAYGANGDTWTCYGICSV